MPKSLADYAASTTSPACKTCHAPPEALEQIARNERPKRRLSVPTVIAWLAAEYGIEVSESSLKRHLRGHLNEGSK